MNTQKPIKITLRIGSLGEGIIPKGVVETLVIEISNGIASYHFNDSKITQRLSFGHKDEGLESIYSERLKKTITKFPNMSQAQIVQKTFNDLKKHTKVWKLNKNDIEKFEKLGIKLEGDKNV